MRTALVFRNNELAGRLSEADGQYLFRYEDVYFFNSGKKPVSLTMPKMQQEFRSRSLFPVFFNMLAEGANKKLQCRRHQIDENDYFSLLLKTAGKDSTGCITIREIVL
jgi:HipA-like protein